MRLPGFIGPAYKLQTVVADCQRCINLYPEINELKTGRPNEVGILIKRPGLRLLATIGSGPIRGVYAASNKVLYVVSGNKIYSVNSAWSATEEGSLSTDTGQVSMADNGITLVVVDGPYAYGLTLGEHDWAKNEDQDFTGADQIVYQDGYFIWGVPDTGRFMISSLYAPAVDPLDFASAEGAPDNIVSVIDDHRELWLFGDKSTEVFYNSGNPDFPFERIQGAFIEHGCVATWSTAKMNNTTFWLGGDDRGAGVVWSAQGYQPKRISNHAIEAEFQSYGDISDATAFTLQWHGHNFYVLSFPAAQKTWVYDTATEQWHEWTYFNNGVIEAFKAITHAYVYSTHVVGDRDNGKIYALDSSVFKDDTAPIKWLRSSPHFVTGLKRIVYNSFQLDMRVGDGLTTGRGDDPQIMIRWSDDGGRTWSNEHWVAQGAIGKYATRAIIRKLGSSRQRVWEVSGTDPVVTALLGAEIDFKLATS